MLKWVTDCVCMYKTSSVSRCSHPSLSLLERERASVKVPGPSFGKEHPGKSNYLPKDLHHTSFVTSLDRFRFACLWKEREKMGKVKKSKEKKVDFGSCFA